MNMKLVCAAVLVNSTSCGEELQLSTVESDSVMSATAGGPAGSLSTVNCSSLATAYCQGTNAPVTDATGAQVYMANAAVNWSCGTKVDGPLSATGNGVAAPDHWTMRRANGSDGAAPAQYVYAHNYYSNYQHCRTFWNYETQAAYVLQYSNSSSAPYNDITNTVSGKLYATFANLGYDAGVLGPPISNPVAYGWCGVTYQLFRNGVVTYSQTDGAHYTGGTNVDDLAVAKHFVAAFAAYPNLLQPVYALTTDPLTATVYAANDAHYVDYFDYGWGYKGAMVTRVGSNVANVILPMESQRLDVTYATYNARTGAPQLVATGFPEVDGQDAYTIDTVGNTYYRQRFDLGTIYWKPWNTLRSVDCSAGTYSSECPYGYGTRYDNHYTELDLDVNAIACSQCGGSDYWTECRMAKIVPDVAELSTTAAGSSVPIHWTEMPSSTFYTTIATYNSPLGVPGSGVAHTGSRGAATLALPSAAAGMYVVRAQDASGNLIAESDTFDVQDDSLGVNKASFASGEPITITWKNLPVGSTGAHFTIGDATDPTSSVLDIYSDGTQTGATSISTPVAGDAVNAIGIGVNFACAQIDDGVKCWGANAYGQLGNGTTAASATPVTTLPPGSGVTGLVVGSYTACALFGTGTVKCWGHNSYGEVGNGNYAVQTVPVAVSGISTATQIGGNAFSFCALLGDGTAKCWGYNPQGQLGNGSTANSNVPVSVTGLTGATRITVGYLHACAGTASGISCWGYNLYGQLGNNSVTSSLAPVAVSNISTEPSALAAGYYHTCAIVSGIAQCWGYNGTGSLGNNTTITSHVPVTVGSGFGSSAGALAAGGYNTCAITSTGGAKCWGYNLHGQLGNGSTVAYSVVPVDVSGQSSGVTAISASNNNSTYHTCSIANGRATCWGYNATSELGNGLTANSSVPVNVSLWMGFGSYTFASGITNSPYSDNWIVREVDSTGAGLTSTTFAVGARPLDASTTRVCGITGTWATSCNNLCSTTTGSPTTRCTDDTGRYATCGIEGVYPNACVVSSSSCDPGCQCTDRNGATVSCLGAGYCRTQVYGGGQLTLTCASSCTPTSKATDLCSYNGATHTCQDFGVFDPDSVIPYNMVATTEAHNSYAYDPGSVRTLGNILDHGIRALELDLHPSAVMNDFWVAHIYDGFEFDGNNCGPGGRGHLSNCLDDIVTWHQLNPNHEVITLYLDTGDDDMFTWMNTPNALDDLLDHKMGSILFKPGDLAAGFPDLVTRLSTIGWPTLDTLRGKVIIYMCGGGHGDPGAAAQSYETYVGNTALTRSAFLCNSIEGSPAVPDSDPNIVFQSYGAGGLPNPALDPEGNAYTGASTAHGTGIYVSRIYRLNTPGEFREAWLDNANFLSTRQWTDDLFETISQNGYPFFVQPEFTPPGLLLTPTFLLGTTGVETSARTSSDERQTRHMN